jgi:uncharacterized protein Usg
MSSNLLKSLHFLLRAAAGLCHAAFTKRLTCVSRGHRLGEDAELMSLALQLKDYRLTTANIYYHLPDFPAVLQTYVWQEYDIAPRFPELHNFLAFWQRNLDGKVHSVFVDSLKLVGPAAWRSPGAYLRLH